MECRPIARVQTKAEAADKGADSGSAEAIRATMTEAVARCVNKEPTMDQAMVRHVTRAVVPVVQACDATTVTNMAISLVTAGIRAVSMTTAVATPMIAILGRYLAWWW